MWLIDTETFRLVFHHECPKDQYAILSHTWEEDEVSFQDLKDLTSARLKKGFSKVDSTVRKARNYGYKWAWVDTCCIDKSSSAELSEAINSMYKWYQQSAICLAFLSDLPTSSEPQPNAFKQCRWWTRGWTLQELIAPRRLQFYDQEWNKYGSRSELLEEIKSITGISSEVFQRSPNNFSVAQRMSWASRRMTTRTEDIAYCLLGLFDINMPLIYGEGEKAFLRLQEEICKSIPDLTIFAWTTQPSLKTYSSTQNFRGLLASHPIEFAGCGHIWRLKQTKQSQWSYNPFNTSMGNWDITFNEMPLQLDEVHGLLMRIGWIDTTAFKSVRLFIPLTKTIEGHVRSRPDHLAGYLGRDHSGRSVTGRSVTEINESFLSLFIANDLQNPGTLHLPKTKVSCLKRLTCEDSMFIDKLYREALVLDIDLGIKITAAYPESFWVPEKQTFLIQRSLVGAVMMNAQHLFNTSDTKDHSLILLFDCDRSSNHRSYETLDFTVIGSCSGDSERSEKEEYFNRLSEVIRKDKLMTHAGYMRLYEALHAGDRGGWRRDDKEMYPSTWTFQRDKTEIRADLDPEQWASGKVVIKLRASD